MYTLTVVNNHLYYGFTSQTSLVILVLHILRLLAGMDGIDSQKVLKILKKLYKRCSNEVISFKNVWSKINKHLVIGSMMEDETGSKLEISNKTDWKNTVTTFRRSCAYIIDI